MNIREIDTADWEASERAEVVALPYTVTSSPYGETLFQAFATEAEAVEAAEYVQGLTGTYNTSWGEQDVNTEVVVSHYVDSTPADAPKAPTAAEIASNASDAVTAARKAVEAAEIVAASTYFGSEEWARVTELDRAYADAKAALRRAMVNLDAWLRS